MRLAKPYQFGGRYVGRNDDGITAKGGLRGLSDSEQVGEDLLSGVHDVCAALPQIGVLHLVEVPQILQYHLFQCSRGGVTGIDAVADFASECRILQYHEVGLDDGRVLTGKIIGGAAQLANVMPRGCKSLFEKNPLLPVTFSGLHLHLIESDALRQIMRPSLCKAARNRYASENRFFFDQARGVFSGY